MTEGSKLKTKLSIFGSLYPRMKGAELSLMLLFLVK